MCIGTVVGDNVQPDPLSKPDMLPTGWVSAQGIPEVNMIGIGRATKLHDMQVMRARVALTKKQPVWLVWMIYNFIP